MAFSKQEIYPQQSAESVSALDKIHPTAIIAPGAELGPNVTIGPFCIIGEHVKIGADTQIGPHVVIDGWTSIGQRNQIATGAIIGNIPQDLKFIGEESYVVIGNENIIREYVTINRGTENGGLVTSIGNNNVIMTSAHIAHDVKINNHTIISNGVGISGHVCIDDWATIGGLSGIHQFTRVGFMSMIGGVSAITKDIPPFSLVNGNPAKFYGLNIERLRRHQYPLHLRMLIQRTYKCLFRSNLTIDEAIKRVELEFPKAPEIDIIVNFIQKSSRGFYRY